MGLLLPLRFPGYFWLIIILTALFGALLIFWVFAEYPNIKRLKEDWFTIVFTFIFTTSLGVFSYLVPNPIVQALLLGTTGVFVYFIYIVAGRLKRGYTPSLMLRNISSFAAILGVFFSTASILRWVLVTNSHLAQAGLIFLTFVAVFVISEFLFEAQGFESSLLYSLAIAFGFTQILWISSFWLISYPASIRITNIGVPLPAIFGTIFFYLFWGLSHHRLETSLSRRVLWEYILISGLFVTILFATAKWLP